MKEIVATIFAIGAFQGLFFSVILFIRRNNRSANQYLAVLLLVMAVPFLQRYLTLSGYFEAVFAMSYLRPAVLFLHGPLIYFYTASMSGGYVISRRIVFHLLPAALVLVSQAVINSMRFESSPVIGSIEDMRRSMDNFIEYYYVLLGIGSLLALGYTVRSLKILKEYRGRIEDYFSDIERINLNWLRTMLILFLAMIIMMNGVYILREMEELSIVYFLPPTLVSFLIILIASFLAINQQDLQGMEKEYTAGPGGGTGTIAYGDLSEASARSAKYEKVSLDEKTSLGYYRSLKQFMEKEKPYLEEELTINELASWLDIPSHHLSIVINRHGNQNFYSFINGYRLKEFKRLLHENVGEPVNILSLAFASGFNSKSTFNHIFKQHTGLTPSEYRKSLQEKASLAS